MIHFLNVNQNAKTLFFLFITSQVALGAKQQLTFFAAKNCQGESVNFTESGPVVNTSADRALSLKVLGVWNVILKWTVQSQIKGENFYAVTLITLIPSHSPCIKTSDLTNNETETANFTHFQKYGPLDTTRAQLILFKTEILQGESYTFESDNSSIAEDGIYMKSFAHFSNKIWIIYPEKNFQGLKMCVCPVYKWGSGGQKEILEDGFQYVTLNETRKVASVKVGNERECACAGAASSLVNDVSWGNLIIGILIVLAVLGKD